MANLIILIAIGILWFFLLVCGIFMIAVRRKHRDRSRLFFGIFALVSSYTLLQKMFFILREANIQDYYQVLPLREICFGMLCRYLFTLYPIEVARPNWLTWRRWLLCISPWLACIALYGLLLGFHQTPLDTFDDVLANLDKPDVVVRLGLLLSMLPFEFVWTLTYDTHHSSAGRAWLRRMTFMVSIIALAFVGNMLTRSVVWRSIHSLVYMAYTLYVMYIELFVRIPVPCRTTEEIRDGQSHTPSELPVTPLAEDSLTSLQQRLRTAMEEEELWREPELSLEDLACRVGSNRTYITRAIQQMGYTGFKDYLNRLRVRYISQRLRIPQHERMQALFYDAGYRSRGSAWRNFTAIMGCSPSEYEEQNKGTRD